jgi:redox-sensitive bicupin YhaK (pirin superfamily)
MLMKRASKDRGHANHGWLDTRHSFSFADYDDPRHRGFRALRVINEDIIAPHTGFGEHGHRDMEIISWVLDGALQHRDSLGSGGILRPGDAQVMTAGSGIRHSEMNPSTDQPGHFLQIWISPRRAGYPPTYDQRTYPPTVRHDRLCAIASGDGRDGSLIIQQDAVVYASLLGRGRMLQHSLAQDRHAWIQVAQGSLSVNNLTLAAGDGLAISDEPHLSLHADADSEFLIIDLS